ncbi:MAG: DUF1080 domain-containing protein [Myxococcales bacterium]
MGSNPTQHTQARGKDFASHLLEDLGKVVEDFRHIVDEGVDEKAIERQERAIKGVLGKAREFLKKAPVKRGEDAAAEVHAKPDEARPEPSSQEETASQEPEPAPTSHHALQHVVEGLGKVIQLLQSVREELQSAIVPTAETQGGGFRGAFGKAKRFMKRKAEKGEQAESEQAPEEEQQAKGEQTQEEEKQAEGEQAQEEEQQAAQQGDGEQMPEEEQHAAQQGEGEQKPEEEQQAAQQGEGEQKPEEEQQAAQQGEDEQKPEVIALFGSTEESFRQWKLVGAGSLEKSGEELRLQAANDRGLVYFTARRFDDFKLSLKYKPDNGECQMSAFVRFLDPELPVPDRDDPNVRYPYDNQAFVAVHTGFEIQLGAKRPTNEPGIIEGVLIGEAPGSQRHPERGEIKPGEWNDLEIEVTGNDFRVRLNGKETAWLSNADSFRGKPASAATEAGFVGLGLRSGSASLRDIRAEILSVEGRPEVPAQVSEQQGQSSQAP